MEETKKKGSGTTDLTVGRPLTRILQFALPLVLGTLFQQLYSFVDTIIVGRCIGTDALGAVGTTYSLNFMIVGFVLATCNGFGIPVAESFGAKDRDDLHKYLFNGAVLCVGMSLVFAVGTTLVAAPLLQLIHTPAELLENAVHYIRIIFLGILFHLHIFKSNFLCINLGILINVCRIYIAAIPADRVSVVSNRYNSGYNVLHADLALDSVHVFAIPDLCSVITANTFIYNNLIIVI